MSVERVYLNNSLRNFNYFFISRSSGAVLVIDPFDAELIFETCKNNSWKITAIFNTHEHHDHTKGNLELKKMTNATVYGPAALANKIPGCDVSLRADEELILDSQNKFKMLSLPGHTLGHAALFHDSRDSNPCLFCGDTIFNAGCGNCYRGGDAKTLYSTLCDLLLKIPDDTILFPGHDYLENNLQFAAHEGYASDSSAMLLSKCEEIGFSTDYLATLSQELEYNPFLKICKQPTTDENLAEFLRLRAKRDSW